MSRWVVLAVCAGPLVAAHAQEPDEPLAALTAQLKGKDPKVRRRAAKELGRLGGEQAIPALSQALADKSESVRHEAAIALARLAPDQPNVVGVLVESLKNEDWYVRWQACLALRSLGPRAEDAVPALMDVLRDAKLDNLREAALALTAIAPKRREVVDALIGALQTGRAGARHAVFFGLRRADATDLAHIIPWLAREAHGNEHGCSEPARRLLEHLTGVHAEYFLMLFAPDEQRRTRAVAWISGPARDHYRYPRWEFAVPALMEALKDESRAVRLRVLGALCQIGPHAKAALPEIVRCTVSSDKSARDTATGALKAIAPSLARVIETAGDEGKARLASKSLQEVAGALLDLLTDPTIGDATLAALAEITGRTQEDLLQEVRAAVAKK